MNLFAGGAQWQDVFSPTLAVVQTGPWEVCTCSDDEAEPNPGCPVHGEYEGGDD